MRYRCICGCMFRPLVRKSYNKITHGYLEPKANPIGSYVWQCPKCGKAGTRRLSKIEITIAMLLNNYVSTTKQKQGALRKDRTGSRKRVYFARLISKK